jgi:serine/threonine protein kinase
VTLAGDFCDPAGNHDLKGGQCPTCENSLLSILLSGRIPWASYLARVELAACTAVSTIQSPVAIKVLSQHGASADKKRRFKNETAFLARNKHPNIVAVIDHGLAHDDSIAGPFYVMHRYDGNLRDLMKRGVPPGNVLSLFAQILDGVEAAHLQGVVHRDLKPENILWGADTNTLAVADFGIASFTEGLVVTNIETRPTQRLANFQYAAPEQRTAGNSITRAADVYALGLILNEMFTGAVPHGTDYRLISSASKELGFLDAIVAQSIRQDPTERPDTIAAVKGLIQKHQAEAISLQRLSKIQGTVVKADTIDDPLAEQPPRLIGFDWDSNQLTLILDRPVTNEWVAALRNMGNFTSVMGVGPEAFSFRGDRATARVQEHSIQQVINYFKVWLPQASRVLKETLQANAQRLEAQRREQLRREQQVEEQRLRVLRNVQI